MIYFLLSMLLAVAALFAVELLRAVWMRRAAAIVSAAGVSLSIITGYSVMSPTTPVVTVGVNTGIIAAVYIALVLLLAQPAVHPQDIPGATRPPVSY